MNFSNISCEYFYDEEYDVAIREGSYNQPFINSLNNNCYPSYFGDGDRLYSEFDTNESDLWSESALKQSGNNNYSGLCCDKIDSNVYKCASTDNVIETSNYSLTKNLPFLNQPRQNLFNYRLCYESRRESITNPVTGQHFFLNNFDIRKQFARKYNSKTFFDSGKCSAATSDSFIHPVRNYRPNSENNLHETSLEENNISNCSTNHKKSSKQLWRKLKQAFSNKKLKWKNLLNDNSKNKLCRSYSAPSLEYNNENNKEIVKCNRYSTTIVELYNLLNDLVEESTESVFTTTQKCSFDVSCQFPELKPIQVDNGKISKKPHRDPNIEYPGIGKLKLPHRLRTPIYQLIADTGIFNKLKFLEQISNTDNSSQTKIRRSRSVNRSGQCKKNSLAENELENVRNGICQIKTPTRSSSESRKKLPKNSSIKDSGCPLKNTTNTHNNQLFIIEENKSLSFADLRPIPRNWGLSKDNDILAMFEFPRRSSNDFKVVEYEEENSFRLGGIVNNAITAIKLASDSVSSIQEVATICDKFIRCKDSNRQSTSALLLAVDTIIALISDGLYSDSVRNKKSQNVLASGFKMTQKLWLFIEESCRGTLIKDPSQKLALSNLLKQVKQTCGLTNTVSRSKEWAIQLKLQIFIVLAIKNNLLHVWVKAVVANDTILHRFFNSNSFLRQARTSYSNALSAVVVEMRHLCMPGSSRIYNVSKPISSKSRNQASGQSSNSSTDNSLVKSRIPRSNKRPSNAPVKG